MTTGRMSVPQGYGPGVGHNANRIALIFWPVEGGGPKTRIATILSTGAGTNTSWFGNYDLESGTIMFARPFGGKLGGQQQERRHLLSVMAWQQHHSLAVRYQYVYGDVAIPGLAITMIGV